MDGLYDLLGEYANLDELNYLASKLDDMSQDEYERFQSIMEQIINVSPDIVSSYDAQLCVKTIIL